MEVKVQVCQRRFDVTRQYLEVVKGFKAMIEALFRCNVQQLTRVGKKVTVAL
jgi:hypothetical protein